MWANMQSLEAWEAAHEACERSPRPGLFSQLLWIRTSGLLIVPGHEAWQAAPHIPEASNKPGPLTLAWKQHNRSWGMEGS